MQFNKKFLRFRYAAIRRYGERWTVFDGVIEFNPNYCVGVSSCEKEDSGDDSQKAYIVELSNGTKLLVYLNNYGCASCEEILSEQGERANMESDTQRAMELTRVLIHRLESNGRRIK